MSKLVEGNILLEWINDHQGIKSAHIAREMGVSGVFIANVLSGKRNLNSENLFKLCKVLSRYGLELKGFIFRPCEIDAEVIPSILLMENGRYKAVNISESLLFEMIF